MNSKKRKAEDELEETSHKVETTTEKKEDNIESETNVSNSQITECSTDRQNSDNGAESQPGTSVDGNDANSTNDNSSNENQDVKQEITECSTDRQNTDNGAESQPGPSVDGNEANSTNDNSSNENQDVKQEKVEENQIVGTLLFAGGTNWDLIGRKELPKNAKGAVGANLWGPHKIASLQGIRVRGIFSGCTAVHSVLITDTGLTLTWGRNDKYQLGLGDAIRRDIPTVVDTLKDHNIVSAACGRSHTLFLTDRGNVFSCGANHMGQCGVGSQQPTINIPTKVKDVFKRSPQNQQSISFKGRIITHVSCGAEFSMIVDDKHHIHSFGCPEYGQLGHNTDGKYFVTSNKLSFRCELIPRQIVAFVEKSREGHVSLIDDVQIVSTASGINHTVAMDSKGRAYSFGFGGYGRLGHAEQKDEYLPRLIKTFDGPKRGVKKVFAGGTFSMAINEYGVLMFWGMNRRSGEASMYPKNVPELVGWCVRDVGCANSSIVTIADDSIVSWGPSPTWGELGYGESRPKSSTTPQEVKLLDNIHIHTVTCGYGHTLFIARDDSEEDRKKLNQLPEYTP